MHDLVIANSVGITQTGLKVIHSPSRWSEAVEDTERHFSYYPFYLGTLSTLLKNETKLKIKFLDGCLKQWDSKRYKDEILKYSPKYLFIESASLTFEENLLLALEVKKECGSILMFAGPHVSLYSDLALAKGIDHVFCGEYESNVLDFFKSKKNNRQKVYRSNQSIHFSKLPWPEDEDVSRLEYGLPGEPSSEYKEIQMYATRGCRGNCSFCVVRQVYYKAPKHECRDPIDVVNEMYHLKEKYPDLEGFFFDEEDHFDNFDFMKAFCLELINRSNQLKIEGLGRITGIKEDLYPLLKKAGYYKIRIGIESLHPDIQKTIKKKISIEMFEKFLLNCKKYKLQAYTTFQVGLPGSTKEKDLYTLNILTNLLKKDLIHNLQVSIFTPFPGTPGYEDAKPYLSTTAFEKFNGGTNSVINWPNYKAKEITQVYHQFLSLRDHIQFINRLKNGQFYPWVKDRLRKHRASTLVKKSIKRLFNEARFALRGSSLNKKNF